MFGCDEYLIFHDDKDFVQFCDMHTVVESPASRLIKSGIPIIKSKYIPKGDVWWKTYAGVKVYTLNGAPKKGDPNNGSMSHSIR